MMKALQFYQLCTSLLLLIPPIACRALGGSAGARFAVALGRSGFFVRPLHHHLSLRAHASSKSHSSWFSKHSKQPLRTRLVARPLKSDDGMETTLMTAEDNAISLPTDRPLLAVADIVAFLGFAAVGKASHGVDGSLDLAAVATTAFPFLLSWLATSPWTGVYKRKSTDDSGVGTDLWETLKQTAKGWAVAVPLGCVLRGWIKGYAPPISFVVVTLITTLLVLTGARFVVSVLTDSFSAESSSPSSSS